MFQRLMVTFIFAFFACTANGQTSATPKKPRLIVGLVVDQMRWDYLYRYQASYQSDGFKRLLKEGLSCENTLIPYVPTYTAAGHACVYTGTVPAINGIVGNNWYDASLKRDMYCAEDTSVSTVGSTSDAGKMSPRNLLTTTIGDELKLSSNFRSKVFGIALKDRGAILPAGHAADHAFWYDDAVGQWISSTYYAKTLPAWLVQFNAGKHVEKYMSKDWNTLLPIEQYVNSTADEKPYEGKISGVEKNTFPHRVSAAKKKFSAFKTTPFAATYTFDLAKELIRQERLGQGEFTDLLAISISSTDYAGHTFGPNSIEVEDSYLRLDRDIADMLKYLDKQVGAGNYVLFLTADHAAAHAAGFMEENKLPGGRFSSSTLNKQVDAALKERFGQDKFVVKNQNYQFYLNYDAMRDAGVKPHDVEEVIIQTLENHPDVQLAFRTKEVFLKTIPAAVKERLVNGYNPKRSGDIGYTLKSGYMGGGSTGTSHGVWYAYDAAIPLVWYGANIPAGKLHRTTYMTDIAPTVAALLQIQVPSGSIGSVIEEVVTESFSSQ